MMAKRQKYGIKYPFTMDNGDGIFLDVNETMIDGVKSQLLHLLFTPKGQKLRDQNFGTDLVKYIFNPSDSETFNDIKTEITSQVSKYIPSIEFRDVTIHKSETDDYGIVVLIEYGVKKGNKTEVTTLGVKL
jgi:phage baseplate assembly protein W